MKFPKRLKELRESKKMTQQELANVFNISRSAITKYENGERSPDPETLQKFADFFNVSVDYLLGRTDDPPIPDLEEIEAATARAEKMIAEAIADDQELLEFWQELTKRDDLQLLFKQVRDLPPVTIKRIIRYIKMVEDEEADE